MRHKTALFFLLLLCCAQPAPAREEPELFARIDRVFKEKEPAWKVERVINGDSADPVRRSVTFRSEAGQANVEVVVWKRGQDARDVFAAEALAFGNMMGKRMVKAAAPGLGDEGLLWTNRGSTAWPMLFFRKGTVLVRVFAPSVAVARRFARHVVGQLPAE